MNKGGKMYQLKIHLKTINNKKKVTVGYARGCYCRLLAIFDAKIA